MYFDIAFLGQFAERLARVNNYRSSWSVHFEANVGCFAFATHTCIFNDPSNIKRHSRSIINVSHDNRVSSKFARCPFRHATLINGLLRSIGSKLILTCRASMPNRFSYGYLLYRFFPPYCCESCAIKSRAMCNKQFEYVMSHRVIYTFNVRQYNLYGQL